MTDAELFPGFISARFETASASIAYVVGGSGAPLLLLHGYPQTRATWHRIAGEMARTHTVVAPDLRGYGESSAKSPEPVASFAKSEMAKDQVELMRFLGFDRFAVAGHDRGGRVAYRLAMNNPDAVSALVSLTVIPTVEVWDRADSAFGMAAWHWYMLAQPFDLPERLIGADPDAFVGYVLDRMAGGSERLHASALSAYIAAFRDPHVRHAMCQDYRAAATIDAEEDARDRDEGRHVQCSTLVLWDSARHFAEGENPLDIWRRWSVEASGHGLEGGHLLPELGSEGVISALRDFLPLHG